MFSCAIVFPSLAHYSKSEAKAPQFSIHTDHAPDYSSHSTFNERNSLLFQGFQGLGISNFNSRKSIVVIAIKMVTC